MFMILDIQSKSIVFGQAPKSYTYLMCILLAIHALFVPIYTETCKLGEAIQIIIMLRSYLWNVQTGLHSDQASMGEGRGVI